MPSSYWSLRLLYLHKAARPLQHSGAFLGDGAVIGSLVRYPLSHALPFDDEGAFAAMMKECCPPVAIPRTCCDD